MTMKRSLIHAIIEVSLRHYKKDFHNLFLNVYPGCSIELLPNKDPASLAKHL